MKDSAYRALAGLRCAVQRHDPKDQPLVSFVCHHCAKPLCNNDGSWAGSEKQRKEKRCFVLVQDEEFPGVDLRFLGAGARDAGRTGAYHCPECAERFHPEERKGCLGAFFGGGGGKR